MVPKRNKSDKPDKPVKRDKPDKSPRGPAHESSDADVGVVLKFGLGLVTLTILVLVSTWWLYGFLAGPSPGEALPSALPPRPRTAAPPLQISPGLDLEAIRAEETELLSTYGWIDRERGIVRVPIDRAMELLLERGAPAPSPGMTEEQESETR